METVTLKMEESLLEAIDKSLAKNRYSTRTEFIREAIRDKISELELREIEKQRAIHELAKFRGSAEVHVSDEQHEKIREEVTKKYARKLGVRL